MRKVIKDFLKRNEGHPIENLLEHILGNVGLVFTNDDLGKIRDVLLGNRVPAPARVGSLAPVDVFVEPGPTGCDPGQTAWFQALNIRPFSYGLVLQKVYDNGQVFDTAVLDVKDEDLYTKLVRGCGGGRRAGGVLRWPQWGCGCLGGKVWRSTVAHGLVLKPTRDPGGSAPAQAARGFWCLDARPSRSTHPPQFAGIATFAAVCIGLGYPTKASLVHSINDAYKMLLAVGMESDYNFPAADKFKNFVANAPAAGAAAPAAAPAAGGAAKVEAKKEEEEEEEAVGGAGGLFGDDDDF